MSKTTTTELGFEENFGSKTSKDVLSALVGLGYSESIAIEVIKRINPSNSDKSIESLIKEALKILNEWLNEKNCTFRLSQFKQ